MTDYQFADMHNVGDILTDGSYYYMTQSTLDNIPDYTDKTYPDFKVNLVYKVKQKGSEKWGVFICRRLSGDKPAYFLDGEEVKILKTMHPYVPQPSGPKDITKEDGL